MNEQIIESADKLIASSIVTDSKSVAFGIWVWLQESITAIVSSHLLTDFLMAYIFYVPAALTVDGLAACLPCISLHTFSASSLHWM